MKQCILCGEDCSARPRVKDAQGHYACKACVEANTKTAASSRSSAPAPSKSPPKAEVKIEDVSDGDMDLSSLAQAESTASGASMAKACPTCAVTVAPAATECPNCGTNLLTGKAKKAPKAAGERKKFQMPKLPFEVSAGLLAFLAFALLGGLLVAGKTVSPFFFALFFLAWAAYGGIFLICVVVVPFFEENKIWGIANGVAIFFGIGILLPFWYVLMRTEAEWLKYMAGVLVLTIIGFLAIGGHKELDAWDPNAGTAQAAPAGPTGTP